MDEFNVGMELKVKLGMFEVVGKIIGKAADKRNIFQVNGKKKVKYISDDDLKKIIIPEL